jgi:hypothetical protein
LPRTRHELYTKARTLFSLCSTRGVPEGMTYINMTISADRMFRPWLGGAGDEHHVFEK